MAKIPLETLLDPYHVDEDLPLDVRLFLIGEYIRGEEDMAAIDKAFYELAVKERDYERHKVDKLQLRNDRLTYALNAVADLVGPEVDPHEDTTSGWMDELTSLRYEIQKALEV